MSSLVSHKYIFKYIIVGDMSVGKSCLAQRFTERVFRKDLNHTIGVEFATTIVDVGGDPIKLQIWDTAGHERFLSITRSYYRGAAAALLVYDVTRRASFQHVASTWLVEVRKHTGPHTVLFLIANKCDLEEEREVSFEEGAAFAEEQQLGFLECSSLSGDNVEQAFLSAAHRIREKVLSGAINPLDLESGVQLYSAANAAPRSEAHSGEKQSISLSSAPAGGQNEPGGSGCC